MRGHFLIVIGLIGLVASAGPSSVPQGAASKNMFKDCADCPEMVIVPAGSFTMGSPEDEPKRVGEHEDQVRSEHRQAVCGGEVCRNAR